MGYGTAWQRWGEVSRVREPGGDAWSVEDARVAEHTTVVGDGRVVGDTTAPACAPDPDDAIEDLADAIAVLSAEIHAATAHLLRLIAEFDRLRGWERGGFRSCARWLAFRTGIDAGAARERVRAARALEHLPQIRESMERGELSFSKVRALTRAATRDNEEALLELARSGTAMEVERVVRAWKKHERHDEAELERLRHRSRCFSVYPDGDGMYVVRGRLDPEVAAVLMSAVDAACDALYRSEGAPLREGEEATPAEQAAVRDEVARRSDPARKVTPKQRRADAIGLLAARALATGFGGAGANAHDAGADGECADAAHAPDVPGVPGVPDAPGVPISGSRAERYQVMLLVQAEEDGAPRTTLRDGTRVSAETSRRLSCDSSVVEVSVGEGSSDVLDVGRRTRSIPPALRRALEVRDGGCRFPGCGLRFTDGHHIRHWADGGETNLENLVLLCDHLQAASGSFHHRLVHEDGFRVAFSDTRPGGDFTFHDPRGMPLGSRPPALRLPPSETEGRGRPEGSTPLLRRNRGRGVARPAWDTASARYERDGDIPLAIVGAANEAVLQSLDGLSPAARTAPRTSPATACR